MLFMNAVRFKGELLLLACAVIWGATFVTIKSIVSESPFTLVAVRFGIAAVFYLPFYIRQKEKSRSGFIAGLTLGFWVFIGYSFQTAGLETIDASRSAFITHLLVLFTFPLQWLLLKKRPYVSSWIALFIIIPGAWFLLGHQSEKASFTGDMFTLICAFGFAMNITLINVFEKKAKDEELIFLQMVVTSILAMLTAGIKGEPFPETGTGYITGILFLSLGATLLTLFLQVRYQKVTTPARAAILFSMEPVFATLIAFLFLSEVFSTFEWIGAALILTGVIVSEAAPAAFSKRNKNQNLTGAEKEERQKL